jgi:signal transduction histidine kinase
VTPASARRIAWSIWAVLALALVGLTGLTFVLGRGDPFIFVGALSILGYATVGTLIVSRHPGNPIGWLFQWFAATFFLGLVAEGYAFGPNPGDLPGIEAALLVSQTTLPLALGSLGLILLLFPSGRLLSRRWRLAAWGMVVSILCAVVGILFKAGTVDFGVTNPLGIESLGGLTLVLRFAGGIGAMVFSLVSVAGLFVRYRRAASEERQQIRWLAYVGGIAVTLLLLLFLSEPLIPQAGDFLWISFWVTIALGIPAASAIAILRYRLYELDIVVKKTVVFGILAAFITGAYLLVVIGIPTLVFGAGELLTLENALPLVAAAALALLFQPVRKAARRLANRLVYGKRATPYELLAEFTGHAGETYSIDDVLPRMARAAGEGTGAATARVWARVGGELRRFATWPDEGGADEHRVSLVGEELPDLPEADRAFAVRHRGELLGALTVQASAAEPLTATGERLLEDLAGQAALILRNVRLTEELRAKLEELRASRQRLVTAQDEERRRLERNIHDGAQQQLVALAVNLKLARTLSARDPERAGQILDRLQTEAQETMENLRDLARGIYPPLLADKGLAAALESQARKAAVPVSVVPDGIGRYPQEAEAAAYFCVLEALQNVSKYAQATEVTVRLSHENGDLVFTVTDDGKGFDPATTRKGSGLQNMADRVEALGGSVDVASSPGMGTTVTGRIPVAGGAVSA